MASLNKGSLCRYNICQGQRGRIGVVIERVGSGKGIRQDMGLLRTGVSTRSNRGFNFFHNTIVYEQWRLAVNKKKN